MHFFCKTKIILTIHRSRRSKLWEWWVKNQRGVYRPVEVQTKVNARKSAILARSVRTLDPLIVGKHSHILRRDQDMETVLENASEHTLSVDTHLICLFNETRCVRVSALSERIHAAAGIQYDFQGIPHFHRNDDGTPM